LNEAQVTDALKEPAMAALMDKAAGMRIPVNFEEHFDVTIQFVDLYPQVNVIIPHMGGLNGGSQRVLEAVGRKPNVYFDISLAGISEGLIREFGVNKFICGSDHPYGSPSWSIDRIRKLNISEDEKQAVFSGNILSLTGMV
jgi:predicted TIM-barrel fold metal-dependent hydrolase